MCSPELRKKSARNIKKVKNIWTWYFTHMPGRPFWADFHSFWRVGSYRRRNYLRQISSRSVKGFGLYLYPKLGVSHWLWSSPLQQCYIRTTVLYTVIKLKSTNDISMRTCILIWVFDTKTNWITYIIMTILQSKSRLVAQGLCFHTVIFVSLLCLLLHCCNRFAVHTVLWWMTSVLRTLLYMNTRCCCKSWGWSS